MKFYNINDIDGFFEAIDQCKGTVELVTGEGDRLNLKSQLSNVDNLCAIAIIVSSPFNLLIVSVICFSISVSNADVASSRTNTVGS